MSPPDNHPSLPPMTWTPTTCDVIVFPVLRRVGRIRRTAVQMHRTTSRGADAIWRKASADLRRSLERAGIPNDRIEKECGDLFNAVQSELIRLDYGCGSWRPSHDDGAA